MKENKKYYKGDKLSAKLQVQEYYRDNEGLHIPLDKIEVDESGRVDFDQADMQKIDDTGQPKEQSCLTDEMELSLNVRSNNKDHFIELIDELGITGGNFSVEVRGTGDIQHLAEAANKMRAKYPDEFFNIDVNGVSFNNSQNVDLDDDLPF